VLALIYGFLLLKRLSNSNTAVPSVHGSRERNRHRSTIFKVIAIMSVLSSCFALRFAMFLVRPAGGCLPYGVFYVFAYIVPETLPAMIFIYVIMSTEDAKRQEDESRSTTMSTLPMHVPASGDIDQPLLDQVESLGSRALSNSDEELERAAIEHMAPADFDDGTVKATYSDIEEDMEGLKLHSIIEEEK